MLTNLNYVCPKAFEIFQLKSCAEIEVTHDEITANAKSILTVLTHDAQKGAEIINKAEGEDAEDALSALEQLVVDGDAGVIIVDPDKKAIKEY